MEKCIFISCYIGWHNFSFYKTNQDSFSSLMLLNLTNLLFLHHNIIFFFFISVKRTCPTRSYIRQIIYILKTSSFIHYILLQNLKIWRINTKKEHLHQLVIKGPCLILFCLFYILPFFYALKFVFVSWSSNSFF